MTVMSDNMPESINKQERYYKKTEKSVQKRIKGIMKKIKKGYKKWLVINTEDYLRKKEIRKENTQKIYTRICLRRQTKNKRTQETFNSQYVPRRIKTTNRKSNRTH